MEKEKVIFERITISDEEMQEMVRLKEQGVTDKNIAKYFTRKYREISVSTVEKRLLEYYDAQGKGTVKKERRIILTEEELNKLVELKEQRLTYKEVSEYFKQQGRVISACVLRKRLLEYYEKHGHPKRVRKYENDLKEILMSGMTIQEFISEFGEESERESLEEQLEKLRVIAEHSKKEDDKWISDNNFIRIINFVENSNDDLKWYQGNIDRYVSDGRCKKGAIDLIKESIFGNENTDLMVYVLSRANLEWDNGYDSRVFKPLKAKYEQKVDKYLERLYNIENNRRKNKTNSENGSNSEIPGGER